MNLTKMTNEELRVVIDDAYEQIVEANRELQKYEVVRCSICGDSDIAFRGEELPFVTWTKPSGHPLCPNCSIRFKDNPPRQLTTTPVDEIMALLD